jgi:hypothetical protein
VDRDFDGAYGAYHCVAYLFADECGKMVARKAGYRLRFDIFRLHRRYYYDILERRMESYDDVLAIFDVSLVRARANL